MTEFAPRPEDLRRLTLLARAWHVDLPNALRRVLDEFEGSGQEAAGTSAARVAIHAVYDGRRIDAMFDPASERVDITSGDLAGRSYRTPSGAAVEVVRTSNRSVNPNRNGWSFWTVSETGELLQTLRRAR
jgi:hypothetical protein